MGGWIDGWVGGSEQRFQPSRRQSAHFPSPKLGLPLFGQREKQSQKLMTNVRIFRTQLCFASLGFAISLPMDMLTLTPARSLVVSGTLRR